MRRILSLILTLILLLTLIPWTMVSGAPPNGGYEPSYATGLIWDSWEVIEANLREGPPLESALPHSVDLTDTFPTPGNQGQQNSCVAWAVAYALRSHKEEVKQNWGLTVDSHLFSPSYVYNQLNCSTNCPYTQPCNHNTGIAIEHAMRLIRDEGVCSIKSFSYDEADWVTQPTAEQKAEAALYKVEDWYTIRGIDDIKGILADGDGVVIGVNVYPDFDDLSPSNPIFDTTSGTLRGRHVVCLIGYDDEKGAFQFINSWGTGWGLEGYGWISYDLMNDIKVNYYGAAIGFIMGAPIDPENPFTYTIYNGEAAITRYLGNGGDVVVPDTYKGYPVTKIADRVFQNCTSLTGVTIPDSVITIGDSTFSGCTALTNIDLGRGVTTIGNSAFQNCTTLNSVAIPDSVITIGNSTFFNCTALIDIGLGRGVTTIGNSAFQNCTSLKGVAIPDNVITIGNSAFSNCTALTDIDFGSGVITIGNSAFQNNISLNSIAIPDSVTTIGDSAFSGCTALADIDLGRSVTATGNSTFQNCTSLNSIVIPDSVVTIGDSAFSGCTALADIDLGRSLTVIGNNAFQNCTSLSNIIIPDSVITIGNYAFFSCTSLSDIKVNENNPNYASVDGVLFDKDIITLIQYPATKTGAYIIPNGVEMIGDWAFSYNVSLDSVVIPSSVITIGDFAFFACIGLTNVIIPDSVTSIGERAFSLCIALTSVTIPDSVTSIGWRAFYITHTDLTIYCYENSYAHDYAIENEIPLSIIKAETKIIEVSPTPNNENIIVNHITATNIEGGFYDLSVDFEKSGEVIFFLAVYEGNTLIKAYFANSNTEIKGVLESDLEKGKICIWDKNMQPCIETSRVLMLD